jgi:hypothetical protein
MQQRRFTGAFQRSREDATVPNLNKMNPNFNILLTVHLNIFIS